MFSAISNTVRAIGIDDVLVFDKASETLRDEPRFISAN